MDIDGFKTSIERSVPDAHLTTQEALEAHRNLTGFMSLLIKINEREQVVPTKNGGAGHENQ